LSKTVFDLHGGLADYKGKFDALISAHYTAAIILHDRELTLAQFEPARYDDPKLRHAAAEQVEIRPEPSLTGIHAVVEAEMSDGTVLSARCEHPRGSPENPLSRAQIEAKFRTYAPAQLADEQIEAVIDAINSLEESGSVATLMENLRAAPRRAERLKVRA
jgi:2-methylcitrate dehydratase PrpD